MLVGPALSHAGPVMDAQIHPATKALLGLIIVEWASMGIDY